ncbi:MAG: DUF4271 domain-containing protein [Mediterranea sp.]|jgi:hypothetical protein|nr:DUF4271 domain-containing protein [Mediterranea sp.]
MTIADTVGIPLSYSPRDDNAIALVLLACLVLSAIALARSKGLLSRQAKDLVRHRERTSIFDNSTADDVRYLMMLVLQTCVLSGVILFIYFWGEPAVTPRRTLPPILLLGIYAACVLAYFMLKWVVYLFLGWIFFDDGRMRSWLESYFTLIYYSGFLLFPFLLFQVYLGFTPGNMLIISGVILILAKILMLYKWFRLFFVGFNSLFLLILYFCALEILPCLLLYKGMVQMNSVLLFKI